MAKTIRDVAMRAGVSIATVSRVLNKTAQVNEDKRLRVEEAVEALGFIPNQAARSLVQNQTKGIGILLPSLGGDFFSEFLQGIDEATRESDYYALISASHGSLSELKVALKGMHKRVDGLVIMSPEHDIQSFKRLVSEDTHVVLVNSAASGAPFDTINFDNYRGAYLATEHLLGLGHRRIAILKGPALAYDGQERLNGYREALHNHGVYPVPDFEIDGDFTLEAGYNAADVILKLNPRPTAVFCVNDHSALGLMAALQNAGIAIPDTISIVGFDDTPGAQFAAPALTSIRGDIRKLGTLAIERLTKAEPQVSPRHIVMPVDLVVRQSTGLA